MKDMKTKPRLLIIEDEEAILQGLADVFVYNGYEVETAVEGISGLEMALQGQQRRGEPRERAVHQRQVGASTLLDSSARLVQHLSQP